MLIRTPRPFSPPAHSPTIAPMTASVTPDPHPAEDRREGGRDLHAGDDLPAGGPEAAGHLEQPRVDADRMPTIVAMATGKKTIRVRDDELGRQPVAEPQDDERRQREDRRRLGGHEVGAQEPLREARSREQHAHDQGDRRPDGEAEQDLDQRLSRRAATSCRRPRPGRSARTRSTGPGRTNDWKPDTKTTTCHATTKTTRLRATGQTRPMARRRRGSAGATATQWSRRAGERRSCVVLGPERVEPGGGPGRGVGMARSGLRAAARGDGGAGLLHRDRVVRRVHEVRAHLGGDRATRTRSRGPRRAAGAAAPPGSRRRSGPGAATSRSRGRRGTRPPGCVGDEHDRRPGALPEAEQLHVEPLAGERVEGAERLVEEQDAAAPGPGRGRSTTRWRVPPESVDGLAGANSRRPTRPRRSSARRSWRSSDQPASSIGKRTFCSAVRQASRRGSWNTSPTRSSGPVTGSPSMVTLPPSGAIRPAEDPQERALAAAVGADERDDLAGPDGEVDGVEHVRGPRAAERERHAVDADAGAGTGAGRDGPARRDAAQGHRRRGLPRRRHRAPPSHARGTTGRTAHVHGRTAHARARPSLIRTVPSAPAGPAGAGPRICSGPRALSPPCRSWARPASRDPTTGRESHPAPKALLRNLPLPVRDAAGASARGAGPARVRTGVATQATTAGATALVLPWRGPMSPRRRRPAALIGGHGSSPTSDRMIRRPAGDVQHRGQRALTRAGDFVAGMATKGGRPTAPPPRPPASSTDRRRAHAGRRRPGRPAGATTDTTT